MAGQLALYVPDKDIYMVTTADTQGRQGGVQCIYDAFWEEIYLSLIHISPVIHAVRFFILILVSAHIFMISSVLCAWTQTKNIILCITML